MDTNKNEAIKKLKDLHLYIRETTDNYEETTDKIDAIINFIKINL